MLVDRARIKTKRRNKVLGGVLVSSYVKTDNLKKVQSIFRFISDMLVAVIEVQNKRSEQLKHPRSLSASDQSSFVIQQSGRKVSSNFIA